MYVTKNPNPLKALPSALEEASVVAKSFGRRVPVKLILISSQSSRVDRNSAASSVIGAAGGAAIIHIAAHGIFDTNNPMASAIFLSSSNNGVLRPSDFVSVDLSKTSIVSLSACDTGQSEIRKGGEAIGFVRGILLAGAQRVLLTQWKVEDRSASEFFRDFYTQLGDKRDIIRAYQSAILQATHGYAHPFYWAGFVLYSGVPK